MRSPACGRCSCKTKFHMPGVAGMASCLLIRRFVYGYRVTGGRRSSAAPVKWLSRHNGAPAPLFHGPLDRLVFRCISASPITGSWTAARCLPRDRLRHHTPKEKNSLDPVMTGALPRTPASSRELAGTHIYFFRRSGVRLTSSGVIFRSPKAFISVFESIISASA